MKPTFLLAMFSVIVFMSCKKDDITNPTAHASVEGTWKYIGYSGGLAGLPFMSASSSNLYLQLKGTQLILNSGQASSCMQYNFKADSITNSSNSQLTGLLTTSDTSSLLPMNDMKTYLVYLSNDTLTLYPSMCADCFTAIYTPTLKAFECTGVNQ